jgi:hypothetical protein
MIRQATNNSRSEMLPLIRLKVRLDFNLCNLSAYLSSPSWVCDIGRMGAVWRYIPTAHVRSSRFPSVGSVQVDYTGFSTINVQRFGQRFVKKVANPQDILIFSKHSQRRQQQDKQEVGHAC